MNEAFARSSRQEMMRLSDAAVIATNDDAFVAKYAAVKRGYFKDMFLSSMFESCAPLLSNVNAGARSNRPPLINRGTFARVHVVESIVAAFLESTTSQNSDAQVVSLGAGYDTLPFRLFARNANNNNDRKLKYIELDFPSVVAAKMKLITSSQCTSALFSSVVVEADDGIGISAVCKTERADSNDGRYFLLPCDLRDIGTVRKAFGASDIDFELPTLFLAECVLMYMKPMHSDALLKFSATAFKGARYFVNYEPINPNDAFGAQMVRNIAARGSPLLGIDAYPDVQSQKQRFVHAGWSDVNASAMLDAFNRTVSRTEQMRLNGVEFLDEFEEWNLIMSHYIIVLARCSAVRLMGALFGDAPLNSSRGAKPSSEAEPESEPE